MLFPENPDLLSLMLEGPLVPLVCGFIRRDISWRELLTNLYERKSARICRILGEIPPLWANSSIWQIFVKFLDIQKARHALLIDALWIWLWSHFDRQAATDSRYDKFNSITFGRFTPYRFWNLAMWKTRLSCNFIVKTLIKLSSEL